MRAALDKAMLYFGLRDYTAAEREALRNQPPPPLWRRAATALAMTALGTVTLVLWGETLRHALLLAVAVSAASAALDLLRERRRRVG